MLINNIKKQQKINYEILQTAILNFHYSLTFDK